MASTSAPNPQSFYPAPRQPGINPWFIRLPLLLLTGMLLLAIVLVTLVLGFQAQHSDRIFPGVSALGIRLDGMTLDEARSALTNQFDYGAGNIFTFRDGQDFWQYNASDLGLSFDVDMTLAQAYAVGHQGNLARDLSDQAGAWFNGTSIAPVISYDQGMAAARLAEIAAEINRPAVNGSLSLNGTELVVSEGSTGRTLNVAATLAALDAQIMAMGAGAEIPLIINETPAIVWNVEEAARQISTALSGPVVLVATDETGQQLGPWTASVDQIASLLQVSLQNNGDGTQRYDVNIDMSAFGGFIESLAPGLIAAPQDGRFHFDPLARQLQVIQPSVSGRTLNVSETLQRLQQGVFTEGNRIVPVAFNYTLPRYHNQMSAAELGITELVAESTTYFTGSPQNRRTNIAVSASRFDGLIIAPGEEFSFNSHLGEISEEGGFLQGNVIFGGRTVEGIGGGVCQVSTTIFRAAFSGGFAITERNSHGYRVGFYELRGAPPGLDAAIWTPDRDFRFQNNTPHHLLIQTAIYPNDDAIQFRFYSTKHWQAEIEEAIVKNLVPARPVTYEVNRDLQPGQMVQVDYSAEGADVTVYRKIYDMQGTLVREDYEFTHYLPWGAIFQVAPGDPNLARNG